MKPMPLWDSFQKEKLIQILESPRRPEDTFDFNFLDGFVRATCCVPDFLSPLNWSSIIFSYQDPNFENEQEAGVYHTALFALFNQHLDEVLEGKCTLPFEHQYFTDAKKRAHVENWCEGFLTGYFLYQEVWDEMLQAYPEAEVISEYKLEPLAEQVKSLVCELESILDPEVNISLGFSVKDMEMSYELLPENIILFGAIGQGLLEEEAANSIDEMEEEFLEEELKQELENKYLEELEEKNLFSNFETFDKPQMEENIPFERVIPKIGRNDPCSCGSGKKFKKCCLH